MKNPQKLFLVLAAAIFIFSGVYNSPLWARGGGGCLVEGTSVKTPNGQILIENIKLGDIVFGWDGEKIVSTKVLEIIKIKTDKYIEITTAQSAIKTTQEHPFFINKSEIKIAKDIIITDKLLMISGKDSVSVPLLAIKEKSIKCYAYNLIVESPATFLANDFVVHNKGCFLPDTEILMADGSQKEISRVKAGDNLLAFTLDEKIITAPVREIISASCSEYYEIVTDKTVIKVTSEHPLYTGNKIFRLAKSVNIGDGIYLFDGKTLSKEIIKFKRLIDSPCMVYNLRTDYPNTFFANKMAVHNKGGGCFPAGTKVTTPGGVKAIEGVKINDIILSVGEDNNLLPVKVLRVYSAVSDLIEINAGNCSVKTTISHPFLKKNGMFVSAGDLKNGDLLVTNKNGIESFEKITSIKSLSDMVNVYNIEVESPHTFIANYFIVHNKGGFGGGGFRSRSRGSSGSRGSSDGDAAVVIIVGCIILGFIIVSINDKMKGKDQNLDYCYPISKVQKKSEKTRKLIDFISKNDQTISHDVFKKTANDTFLKLQECWQTRYYEPMKSLMVRDLYQEHLQQINSMVRNHEINIMEGLKIDFVEIVMIRYYEKNEKREFTALIQARMKDYYIDDRTKEFIRGDDEAVKFQEFWTFQYDGKNWILRQIEQTKESDALTENNFVEMFTPEQMRQIYGEAESKTLGPVGPWVETDIKTRDDRIHKHLNFLIQTDKIWDENEMKETVRNIFIAYHVARESGELGNMKNFLLTGVFESLQKTVDIWKSKGNSIEFRNLCVRRVDIVLIRNFSDNTKDEFTARVTAHAQKVIKQSGNIIKQDEYVIPFEQYWVFGRKDNKWLLKEILPPSVSVSGKSNIDEDASKEQMEWYYTKDRAI